MPMSAENSPHQPRPDRDARATRVKKPQNIQKSEAGEQDELPSHHLTEPSGPRPSTDATLADFWG